MDKYINTSECNVNNKSTICTIHDALESHGESVESRMQIMRDGGDVDQEQLARDIIVLIRILMRVQGRSEQEADRFYVKELNSICNEINDPYQYYARMVLSASQCLVGCLHGYSVIKYSKEIDRLQQENTKKHLTQSELFELYPIIYQKSYVYDQSCKNITDISRSVIDSYKSIYNSQITMCTSQMSACHEFSKDRKSFDIKMSDICREGLMSSHQSRLKFCTF